MPKGKKKNEKFKIKSKEEEKNEDDGNCQKLCMLEVYITIINKCGSTQ